MLIENCFWQRIPFANRALARHDAQRQGRQGWCGRRPPQLGKLLLPSLGLWMINTLQIVCRHGPPQLGSLMMPGLESVGSPFQA